MLMDPNTALIVGLVAPLVTGLLVPFLAVRANWRDIAGPVGAWPAARITRRRKRTA